MLSCHWEKGEADFQKKVKDCTCSFGGGASVTTATAFFRDRFDLRDIVHSRSFGVHVMFRLLLLFVGLEQTFFTKRADFVSVCNVPQARLTENKERECHCQVV